MGVIPNGKQPDPWTLGANYLKDQRRSTDLFRRMKHEDDMQESRNVTQTGIANNRDAASMERAKLRSKTQMDIADRRMDPAGIEERSAAAARGRGSAGGSVDASGTKGINEFINTLRENGVKNPYALAAIAAHLQHESGGHFGSYVENDNGGPSGGGLQWHDGKDSHRLSELMNYAKKNGSDWRSPRVQAMFWLSEGAGAEKSRFDSLMNSKNYDEANHAMSSIQRYEGWNTGSKEYADRRVATAAWGKKIAGIPLPDKKEAALAQREADADTTEQRQGQPGTQPADGPGIRRDADGRRFQLFYPKPSNLAQLERDARRKGEADPNNPRKSWRYVMAPEYKVDGNTATIPYKMYIDPPGTKAPDAGKVDVANTPAPTKAPDAPVTPAPTAAPVATPAAATQTGSIQTEDQALAALEREEAERAADEDAEREQELAALEQRTRVPMNPNDPLEQADDYEED